MDPVIYKDIIEEVYLQVKAKADDGELASYIPELQKVEPESFGVHISTIENQQFGKGDYLKRFSIQSIAKVFSLSMAYNLLGENIWGRLGVEPSGNAFNSLTQLEAENGKPRNPFINSGALVICDIIISNFSKPKQKYIEFVRDVSDNPELNYSQNIAESEKKSGFRNVALCNFIKSFGNIENEPNDVLDFYFNLCSLEMNCKELTQAFSYLANGGYKLSDNKQILNPSKTKRINAIMQTCGFYDESGEFAFKVGLPGKSGVGGGIIAIHPMNYTIAVWSPKLNRKGNSYKGIEFLEAFTTKARSSIF